MSAPPPRQSRRSRIRPILESLETRSLLAGQPLATPSSWTVLKDQPLTAAVDRTYLSLEGIDIFNGQATWTLDDAALTASHENLWLVYHQATTHGFLVDFQAHDPAALHSGHFQFALPTSATVGPVSYSSIGEYGIPSGSSPNMDLSVDGRSNNSQAGNFTIRQVELDAAGNLTRFAVDFGQYRNVDGSFEWHMPANALPDGTPLTLALATSPTHGSLSFNSDGSFTYTPAANFVGADYFTYTASDGTVTSSPVTVTLNVAVINQPPSFTKGPDVAVTEDAGPQSIANWAMNLSSGASPDEVGQTLSFSVTGNSNPLLFSQAPSIDPTGRLTFTPAPNANGTAIVTIALHDSGGTANGGQDTSATQSFIITLTPTNDVPVLQDQSFALYQGQAASGTLAWSDDGPTVTITTTVGPAHGILSLNPNGTFTYTPYSGFVGTDSFQAIVSDGLLTGNTATVTLNVLPTATSNPGTGGSTGGDSSFLYFGFVMDVYGQPNGRTLTNVAGRTVFDDANDNGELDPGEATAVTDIMGRYDLTLPIRAHTIRLVPKAGWVTPDGYASAFVTAVGYGPPGELYTTMADPVVLDVLAVHPAPVTLFDYTLPWDRAIRDAFAAANAIFANSDTNVRLNLVAVDSVKYTPANDLQLDLVRLYRAGDGALDTVLKRRDLLQADLTILFDAKGDGRRDGIAFQLDPARPDASRGYAVVVAGTNAPVAGMVLAHEIGHLLGADHDAANEPKNFATYAHGYRFTGSDGVLYHDVMAYPPGTTLPFFSSPNLFYAGHALGNAAAADNVRAIRENAYAVASYRGPVVSAPASLAAVVATVTKPTAKPGDAVTAKATVRNNAISKFSGKVAVAYYLSKDKTLDASDVLIKRTSVTARNLAAKGTLASSVAFKVDAKLAAGTYYVLAVATPTGKVADERAAKAASVALKVAAPPKKKAAAQVVAGGFQSARPIVEQATGPERRSGDADDMITGLLLSSK